MLQCVSSLLQNCWGCPSACLEPRAAVPKSVPAGSVPRAGWTNELPAETWRSNGQGKTGMKTLPDFFLVLLSSWVTLSCCVAEGCERSIGGPSWAGFSLIAMSPVQGLTNKLPFLVRSLCGCLWQKAHAIIVLLLLFIKTRSSVLPSHTRLAAWENISYRYLFWKTV